MSSAVESILTSLPIDTVAQQVGLSREEARPVITHAVEALLAGMSANATDPKGAQSLVSALPQHNNDLLTGGIDLTAVDTTDGTNIVKNVFGNKTDSVISALGEQDSSAGSSVFQKLLPILAPIVMAYLAKTVFGGSSGAPSSQSGGGLGDLLGGVLGGGSSQPAGTGGSEGLGDLLGSVLGGSQKGSSGGGLGDVLGGILGGGSQKSGGGIGDLLGGLLGGGKR